MSSPGSRGSVGPSVSGGGPHTGHDSDDDDDVHSPHWVHRQQVDYLGLDGAFGGGLSPQPSSSAECEHRVSPQDPNLSSAARYSPPPPYSSPMEGLGAALDHPDSPMEDLSHGPTLPILPAGVSSSSPTAPDTLPPQEPHALPHSSAAQPLPARVTPYGSANSLFSTQPLPRSHWSASPVLSDDEDENVATVSTVETVAPALGESVWARQRRLSMKNIVIDSPQPGPSGLQAAQASSQLRGPSASQPSSATQAVPRAGINDNLLQPGSSGNHTVSQAGSSSSRGLSLAVPSVCTGVSRLSPSTTDTLSSSIVAHPRHSNSDSDDDDDDNGDNGDGNRGPVIPCFKPAPSRPALRGCLMLGAGEAEALCGSGGGCEASSSSIPIRGHSSPLASPRGIQGHNSPLGSPNTPADNCVVSSSTGHIDSIPPTPVEFQGNDVSDPGSPASPGLASVAILDSTVDSTSGRHLTNSDDPSSGDESDDNTRNSEGIQLAGLADEGEVISTSEAALYHSDDSQDVAMLVTSQEGFSTGPASLLSHLSLLSHFSSSTLAVGRQHSPPSPLPPPSDAGPYLDDPLAIPGPSGIGRSGQPEDSSRHSSQSTLQEQDPPSVSSTDHNSSLGATVGLDSTAHNSSLRATVGLDTSLPLLDITADLSGCTTHSDSPLPNQLTDPTDQDKDESESAIDAARVMSSMVSGAGTVSSVTPPLNQLIDSPNPTHLKPVAIPSRHQSDDMKIVKRENSVKSGDTLSTADHNFNNLNHLTKSYILGLNNETISNNASKVEISERSLSHGSFDQLTADPESLLAGTTLNMTLAPSEPESPELAIPEPSQPSTLAQHLLPPQPSQVSLLVGDGDDDSGDDALLMMVSDSPTMHHNTISLEKPLEAGETGGVLSCLADTRPQSVDEGEGSLSPASSHQPVTSQHPAVTDQDKAPHHSHQVHADFIGADFWCGECGSVYPYQCPNHQGQLEEEEDSFREQPIRTRAWTSSLPHHPHHLVMPEVPELDGVSEQDQDLSQSSPRRHIQAISDKPVKSRAWASLPAQHLTIRKVQGSEEFGVFARKTIPKQTQFGPLEGEVKGEGEMEDEDEGGIESSSTLVYSVVSGHDTIFHYDTSHEGSSNWMRFVRHAWNYLDQNCVVVQADTNLFFLTTTDIPPRTELRVGYSKQYASKRNLEALKPTEEEIKVLESVRKCWPCYECAEGFESSALLQQHLASHDQEVGEEERRKRKRGKGRRPRSNGEGDSSSKSKLTRRVKVLEEEIVDDHSSQDQQKESLSARDEELLQHNQCGLCNLGFTMPEVLRIHQRSHSGVEIKQEEEAAIIILKEENNTCPQCSRVFESDVELFTHVEEHGFILPNPSKPYKCHNCYKSFLQKDRLSAHLVVHGNEAEKPYHCNLCLRRFCNVSTLNTHLKFHMEGSKGYDCPICRQGFLSVATLKAHVTTHCVDDQYKCPTCRKVFPNYSKIRRHIRSYHAIKPHMCSICSKEMPSIDKLKIHMLTHSDRRDFLCQDCGKRFKRKDKLREHWQRMHSPQRSPRPPRPHNKAPPKFVPKVDPTDYQQFVYKCSTCLLGFKRRGMLVNHLNKRHPNVDPNSVPELKQPILKAMRCYYCQYCEKRYRSSSKRKLHILKYHPGAEVPSGPSGHDDGDGDGGAPYSQTVGATKTYPQSCQWCYRQYATRARLLRHQRHHHPELCMATSPIKEYPGDLGGDLAGELSGDLTGELGGGAGADDQLLENSPSVSGEITLGGQLVGEGGLLHGHRLVNLSHGGQASSAAQCSEDDLLTQAMGEISPLAGTEQYVRLIGTRGEGQQMVVSTGQNQSLLVSGDSGQQAATLALVTTDSPDTVTFSLPAGQLFSILPGLSVAGGASVVAPATRTVTASGATLNTAAINTATINSTAINISGLTSEEGSGGGEGLQEDTMGGIRVGEGLNKDDNMEGVVLAAHQPSSPSNSMVWQQTLAFTTTPT